MTELEKRLAAVELVIIELTPWLNAGGMEDAARSIEATLAGDMTADEREVRLQALKLLTDGQLRFAGPKVAAWIRDR